jgi:curved DNA-binding protein
VKVRIPKGATDGQKLRVPGKGGKGIQGGPDGDLHLTIVLQAHPLFKAVSHDLYLDLPITPWEAGLGASVDVPTMEGRVRVKVPPGAKSGQKLRLTGKGLPKPAGGHGDLYAVLQVVVPPTLNPRERELFEELGKVSSFNPRAHLEGR